MFARFNPSYSVDGPVTEERTVHTADGTVTAEEGDFVLTDRLGGQSVVSAHEFYAHYSATGAEEFPLVDNPFEPDETPENPEV